ncbi:unnamed protein product [Somion occarium]|uniref:Calcineurin-like phosphoesterase domain-containing protein n=1 Tax=Somion occarium TaxID=3059160 RepID=A0ABP1DIT1_9APHY
MSSVLSSLIRLRPRPTNLLRLLWCLLLVWYEIGTFYHHVSQCTWPDSRLDSLDVPEASNVTEPTHVLLVADPQILDQRSYPGRDPALMWLTQRIVDMNMRRSWRATQTLHPDVVVFLGDMMDGGRFAMSDPEYESYYNRFKDIFFMKKDIPVFYIPGNHDIGLGNSEIANHSFVMVNAPGLVDEDNDRAMKGVSYARWAAAMPGGPIEFVYSTGGHAGHSETPTILLTHIPLARPEGSDCGPLREKWTIHQGVGFGYQNTLSDEASEFVLQALKPSAIFSGDDHDYCGYWHTLPGSNGRTVKEVSVKSFSMAMGVKVPGFQLLSLFPASYSGKESFQDIPCFLPNQNRIYLSIYVPLVFFSLLSLLVSNFHRVKALDNSQTYWNSSGTDAMESWAEGRAYLDAGAWRATTPTSIDEQVPLRKVSEAPNEDEDDEAYSLPVPGSSARRAFARSRTCSKSWSFILWGRRRHMTLDSSCLSSVLSPFFYQDGRNPMDYRRSRAGFFRGVFRDVFDVAWPALVLFVLLAWWTFL